MTLFLPRQLMLVAMAVLVLLATSGNVKAQQRNFRRSDTMVITYLFPWYDCRSYEQLLDRQGHDYLTVHPPQTTWYDRNPDYRQRRPAVYSGSPEFTYNNPAYFAQQLQWLKYASIDAAAVIYSPGEPFQNRSRTAATNLNTALDQTAGAPSVCMFLDTPTYLQNVNLSTEAGAVHLFNGIYDFYSRISPQYWLSCENKIPVILYRANNINGLVIAPYGFQRAKQLFKQATGRDLAFFGNETWRSNAPGAIDFSATWGAANRVNRTIIGKDLAQVSPGQNYRGDTGNAPRSVDGYRAAWEEIRRQKCNWVGVETFDEQIEASCICPTVEDGNAFLNITQSQARRLKAGN